MFEFYLEMERIANLMGHGRILDATIAMQRALVGLEPKEQKFHENLSTEFLSKEGSGVLNDSNKSQQDVCSIVQPSNNRNIFEQNQPDVVNNNMLVDNEQKINVIDNIFEKVILKNLNHVDLSDVKTRIPLSELVRLSQKTPDKTLTVAENAQFVDNRFFYQTNYGWNEYPYKVYIPSSLSSQNCTSKETRVPLVVMIHGCNQNPTDFALGTSMNDLAEQNNFIVVYPQQNKQANSHGCWNWFKPENQKRNSGEAFVLAEITRKVIEEYPIDSARVYVAGMSSGAAMVGILSHEWPDLFAGAGLHSGLDYTLAYDINSALSVMRWGGLIGEVKVKSIATQITIPTIIFQGGKDTVVNFKNAQKLIDKLVLNQSLVKIVENGNVDYNREYKKEQFLKENNQVQVEYWFIPELGHAWSGGNPNGSYTDSHGPNASEQMIEFFFKQFKKE